jgi:hypothetical protein
LKNLNYQNLKAVVLWTRRSREADKIVGIFTNTQGRLTARATSAARSTAKFAGLTEPFVESDLHLYRQPGQLWGKIVGGQLLRSFPNLRLQIDRSTAAAWVCEVVYRLTPEEQPSLEKYELLTETLAALEQATHFATVRLAFAVRFLSLTGFGMDNREPWQILERDCAEWAGALRSAPLMDLGDFHWSSPALTSLEHLAGSIVTDHLNRPLQVNRFRQMTGIEI